MNLASTTLHMIFNVTYCLELRNVIHIYRMSHILPIKYLICTTLNMRYTINR